MYESVRGFAEKELPYPYTELQNNRLASTTAYNVVAEALNSYLTIRNP